MLLKYHWKNPLSKNFGWTKDELIQGLPYQEKIFIGGEVMLEKIVASLKEFISWRPRIWNKQWTRRYYSRLCNNLWFDINENLVQEEGIILIPSQVDKHQSNIFNSYSKLDIRCCKDCKVIPRESVTTQYRVVVLDICIKRW